MSNNAEQTEITARQGLNVRRREILLAGGASLIGLTLRGGIFAAVPGQDNPMQKGMMPRGVMTVEGAKKPVFVPAAGSTDPVAHSVAESLFWLDQETEHAKFFAMMLPTPDLSAEHSQAEQFQSQFAAQLDKVKGGAPDKGSLASFNQATIDLVKTFLDFKQRLNEAQKAGKLKSLIYPTFFDHTYREADRFQKRLGEFSKGKVELDRSEVVEFWSRIMMEHADFVAHLLDPEERMLIEKAMKTSDAWREAKKSESVKGPLDEFIAFKKTAQQGIDAGQIKSIIHPALADHVLREALKFSDELKRTEAGRATR
jgi:hypothetical protein